MSFHVSPNSGLILPNSVKAARKPDSDFSNVRVFARNGFVIFERPTEDGTNMQSNQVDVEGARIRYARMGKHVDVCRKHASSYIREKVPALTAFLERLQDAIRKAEEQGPFSEADMRRARIRSAPKSISFPQGLDND